MSSVRSGMAWHKAHTARLIHPIAMALALIKSEPDPVRSQNHFFLSSSLFTPQSSILKLSRINNRDDFSAGHESPFPQSVPGRGVTFPIEDRGLPSHRPPHVDHVVSRGKRKKIHRLLYTYTSIERSICWIGSYRVIDASDEKKCQFHSRLSN